MPYQLQHCGTLLQKRFAGNLMIGVCHVYFFRRLLFIWVEPTALIVMFLLLSQRVETRCYKIGRGYASALLIPALSFISPLIEP